ncbi:MAG: AAA family ATPase [Pseudomonadota bacterium]
MRAFLVSLRHVTVFGHKTKKVQHMRVFVYGAPGAGKTTLALMLAKRLGCPLHHLDSIFFLSRRGTAQA